MPWFVSKRKLAQEQKTLEAQLTAKADERVKQARIETGLKVRHDIMARIESLPRRIRSHVTTWSQRLVTHVLKAVEEWHKERAQPFLEELRTGLSEESARALAAEPALLIQKAADKQRRTITETATNRVTDLFRVRARERIDTVSALIEQHSKLHRGAVSTGAFALPSNTRFFFEAPNGRRIYVIEQNPSVRTITYRDTVYRIALPFMVFLAYTDNSGEDHGLISLHAFFRNTRLTGVEDELFAPMLTNINDDGVCFTRPYRNRNPSEVVDEAVQRFWGSEFNTDYRTYFDRNMQRAGFKDWKDWERFSARDPSAVLSFSWSKARFNTLKEYVEYMLGDSGSVTAEASRAARDIIASAVEGVRQDTLEVIAELVPRFKLEEITATVIADNIREIWSSSIARLEGIFVRASRSLFQEMPDKQTILADGDAWREQLLREADQELEWSGIVPTETKQEGIAA